MNSVERFQADTEGLFPELLGLEFVQADEECIRAELTVRPELCTVPGVLHGGVIMAFADTLGACGTGLNLPAGAGTTTIESKTNFFAAGRVGERLVAECVPLHRGRRTMVWQTRITRPDGRTIAQVTQTQIVLLPEQAAPRR